MSVTVMALVYRARLGCPLRKAVALKLADCCDDNGDNIWPAVAWIAEQAEIAERTVQYKLRELETCGLLAVTAEGGGRRKSTSYRFDMGALFDLAAGRVKLHVTEKGFAALEPVVDDTPQDDPEPPENGNGAPDAPFFAGRKGAPRAPFENGNGAPGNRNGAPGAPNPLEPLEPPSLKSAQAREGEGDLQPFNRLSGVLDELRPGYAEVVEHFLEPVTNLMTVQHGQPRLLLSEIARRLHGEPVEVLVAAADHIVEQRHKLVAVKNATDAIATARQISREAAAAPTDQTRITKSEHPQQWAAWRRWAEKNKRHGLVRIMDLSSECDVPADWPPRPAPPPSSNN